MKALKYLKHKVVGMTLVAVAAFAASAMGWIDPASAALLAAGGAALIVTTAAGTTISITAQIPATFDQAGYEASAVGASFMLIGEVVSIGAHGRTYAPVTHLPLSSRTVRKFKGSRDDGNIDVNLARDSDDAGQIVAKAALDSDSDYSFRVVYPSGDVEYFQGKVMAITNAADGADSIVGRTMSIAITANSAGVGIVEVLAA